MSPEEFTGQATASPSPGASPAPSGGGISAEDFAGGSPSPGAAPSATPGQFNLDGTAATQSSGQSATDAAMGAARKAYTFASVSNPMLWPGFAVGQTAAARATLNNAAQKAIGSIKPIAAGMARTAGMRFGVHPGENVLMPMEPGQNYDQLRRQQDRVLREDPFFAATQKAPEVAAKMFPIPPGLENKWYTQAGGAAGSFVPIVASGPFAPFTIGMETIGDKTEHVYEDNIRRGMSPDAAAKDSFDRAIAAGATQAALWQVLPKPLHSAFDRYLIDKVGVTGWKRFLLNRAANAGEGAVLGAATQIPTNIASGDPALKDVAQTAGGLALAQTFFPRGKTHAEHEIEKTHREQILKEVNSFLARTAPTVGEVQGPPIPPPPTKRFAETPGEEVGPIIEQPAKEEVKTDAPEKRNEPADSIDEHTGISSRGDLQENLTEAREGGSEPPGGGGGTGAAAAEQKPQPITPGMYDFGFGPVEVPAPHQPAAKRFTGYQDRLANGEELPEHEQSQREADHAQLKQAGIAVPDLHPKVEDRVNPARKVEGYMGPPDPNLPRPKVPVPAETLEQREQVEQLKAKAIYLQNKLGKGVGKPNNNQQANTMADLWQVWSQLHKIRREAGVRRKVGIVGWGPFGLTVGDHMPYEGPDTVIIGKGLVGGQAAKSQEIFNVGIGGGAGIKGRDLFGSKYATAKTGGAEFVRGDVVDIKYANGKNGNAGLDIYVGERDSSGKVTRISSVIPVWRVAIAPGARPSSMLKFYPFLKDAGWGDAENLRRKSKGGKTVMTYGAGNATSQAILGAVEPDDGAKKVFAVSRKPFKTETSNNQVDRLDDWVNEGKVEYVSGSILGAEQLPNGKWIARVGTEKRMPDGSKKVLNEKTFEVDHIENFLGSTYNTDWLPNEIEVTPFTRVVTDPKTGHKTEVQIPLPQKPGLIKMLNGAKQTTMEGVYAGGDARAGTDFMEEPPRRIDRATGDAAGIAASIHSDLQHLEKYGKLPEWNPRSKEVKEADQRLKDLLDSGEPQSPTVGRRPSGPETTGSQATKNLPATPSAMPSRSTSEPSTSPKTRAELLKAQEDAHAKFVPLRDLPLDDPERVAAWSVFKAARDAFNKSKPPPPRFDPSVAHKARGLIESAVRTQKEVIAAEEKAAKARKIRFGEAGTTLFQPTTQQPGGNQQQDFPTPKGRVRLAPGEAAPPAEYPPGKIARFNKYDDAQLQAELRQRTNLKPYTDAEIGGELSRRQALTQGRQETPPVQIQPKGDFLDNPYQNFVEQGFQQRAEARAQERPPSEHGMIAEPEIPEFPSRPPNLRERLRDSPQTLSTPDLVDAIGEGRRLRDTFGRPETREEKQLQTDLTGKIDSLQKIVDAREKRMMEDPALVEAEARRRVTDNPTYPDKLVSDLATGKKASIDAADEKILLNQRAAYTHGRDTQGNRAMDKTLDPGERASAASQYEDLNKKIDLMDEATDNGNRIKGAPARNLWHQFRQRDYELPSMERKLSIAKGGVPLTKAETADLKVKTDRLARAMTDVQAAKVKTGWTPGLGANVAPGLRHKQYVEHQAKEALDDTIFKETMKNRGLLNKSLSTTGQVVDLSRAVMTSMDLSAIRRQGGLFFMGSPARSARIMKDMLRAAKSDEGYFKLMQDIRERPNAQLYIDSKLGLTDIRSPKLSALEEMYMSRWADKIPLVNNSQRAYVYFLNRLRADVFDTMAGNLGQKGHVTLAQAKDLSNFINVFSGRGTLEGDAANAAALLNRAFFAPRYVISRFQALTLQPLRYAHDPKVRMLIAKEYAKTLIGYAVTYGLVAAALPMLGASVEYDPRSSDFGKIKIGNTRIDILSGLGQATVLLARLITGHTKTPSGKIQKLYGKHPVSQRDVDNVILDMFRSKLAPIPAATWNAAKGKKVTGEETNIGWEALGLVTPLSGKDIYTALLEQGVVKGTALGLIAFFGDSVNTYATRGRVRQRKAHRSR